MNTKPVIVALDFANSAAALALAQRLDPALCRVKVGKELFTTAGPAVVDALMKMGFDVFLDLKFHDIPNTVAGACKVAARQGVWMVNVHAAGGKRMLEAAVEAVAAGSTGARRPLLIGVTILTSMGVDELPEIGLKADMQEAVHRYAALCKAAGLDGVVCSAQEASRLKATLGADFKLVTPGIRLAGDAKGDQTRVVTPAEAIKMGSDYLVIGRSVTGAEDPVAVLTKINESLKVAHA
jgi:orotidine-5'-phosphate decarboxylase